MEWLRALLGKYKQHQVVIFDPYFDTTGLGLMLLCAVPTTDYLVFRSLPKPIKDGRPLRRKSDKTAHEGINNLLANCEQNRHLLNRIRLRIYGLKEGRLHDRYILIIGADKLPVAGFNLSNSLQTTAENYPLMVTPIPADILLKVEQYKSGLVQEAEAAQSDSKTENPSMQLLFDSTASPIAPRRYEPLRFLEKSQAGNVLSAWTNESSLHGLSGGQLKQQMATLGLIDGDTLALSEPAGLGNFVGQQVGDFTNFTGIWEVLGEVLAHSRTEHRDISDLASEQGFLEFLTRFLEASFSRTYDEGSQELAVTATRFFREPVDALLYSSYHPHHFSHPTKYAALTWPEYFTIKLLWRHAPHTLLAITETQVASLPIEPQGQDAVRISLLSQIVSIIALSIQFDINTTQKNRLVRSSNGLLQWMGLNAIEQQLEKPAGLDLVLQLIAEFSHFEKVRVLGWMIHRAANNPQKNELFNGLVAALHEAMPTTIPAQELRCLVDSMRGHMRMLAYAEPWLFQDVIFPLLRNDRAKADDACEIWVQELTNLLGPEKKHQPRLFARVREGQTTNITAFLFAYSSPEQQRICVMSMHEILKRQERIVRQPLASTSDWARWNDALTVSMWILIFTRWVKYYLRERGIANRELEELSQDARQLAMIRPIAEWGSEGPGNRGEFVAFLDQVEELLRSSDKL